MQNKRGKHDSFIETDWLFNTERTYSVIIVPRVVVSDNTSHALKMIGLCENEYNAFLAQGDDAKRIGLDYNGNPYRV